MDRRRIIITVVVLGLLATAGVTTFFFLRGIRDAALSRTRALIAKEEIALDIGSVVTRVQGLSRLETAAMRVTYVGGIEQSYGIMPNALAGDKIKLMAVGEVIAGVDLSGIRREHAHVDPDGTLVLMLPSSQILVSRLDNTATRVLDRDTGLFTKADIGLEGRARQAAEIAIRREALNKGILTLATSNAETKLAAFLTTLGATRIRFERQEPTVEGGSDTP